jgi:thiol-disulfide isomerase/thioredoxin
MQAKMPCYLCGAETGGRLGPCDDCLRKRSALRTSKPAIRGSRVATRKDLARSGRWLLLLPVAALLILFVGRGFGGGSHPLPDIVLEDQHGDTQRLCSQGRSCLIAYLTPWCPACKSTLRGMPELAQWVESERGAQFHLVIGNSDQRRIRDFASGSSVSALLDFRDEVPRKLRGRSVPRFYLVDSNGIIVRQVAGFVGSSSPQGRRQWFESKFKL